MMLLAGRSQGRDAANIARAGTHEFDEVCLFSRSRLVNSSTARSRQQ